MTFALAVVPVALLLLGFPIFLVLLTAVTPRLPRIEPTPPCTKSTKRWATLPRPISSPA